MEHPRKLERENNDVQNLEGGASLDEAKGQCSGYNWETSGGIQRLYPSPRNELCGGHRWIGWYRDTTDATFRWWPLDVGCRAERLCAFLSVVCLWMSWHLDLSLSSFSEAKPPVVSGGGGGSNGGDKIWPRPDLGVAAGEGNGFCFIGVGVVAPTMKNDGEKNGYGDQNQPTFEVSAEMQQLQDDFEIEAICAAFNRLQLRELERIFQRTQFPNVFGR